MTVGMVLAAIAFVCAALIQLQIDVSPHWLLNYKWIIGLIMVHSWQSSQFVLETTVQKTLPDFPSSSQAQLKLLNMGSSPVALSVEGRDVQLPAYQVRSQMKW